MEGLVLDLTEWPEEGEERLVPAMGSEAGVVLDLTDMPEDDEMEKEIIAFLDAKLKRKKRKWQEKAEISRETIHADACEVCKGVTVGGYMMYEGRITCGLCRQLMRGKITAETEAFLRKMNDMPCTFCGATDVRKNYDHINMFEKTACICEMVWNGCSLEEITAEVAKCQVVCVPCHKKITKYERKCGFFKKKISLNKKIRMGEDVEDLRVKYSDEYLAKIGPFYESMRGGGGLGGK